MDPCIADKVARFPTGPGVHLFTDALGGTLYVGKAADLRARVRSYLKAGGDGRYQLRFLSLRCGAPDPGSGGVGLLRTAGAAAGEVAPAGRCSGVRAVRPRDNFRAAARRPPHRPCS